MEHEKFLFNNKLNKRIDYEKVEKVLKFLEKYGWSPIKEKNKVIGLKKKNKSITLEPGNQVELSGAPLNSIHLNCSESYEFLDQLKNACKALSLIHI